MQLQSLLLSVLAVACTTPAQQPSTEATETIGWADGDLAPDVQVTDQFGDPLSLGSLGGSVVLVDVTALWATVGSDIPEHSEALAQEYAADGLVYVTVITEDVESHPPDQGDLLAWADLFGVTGPVVGPSELWPDSLGAWLVDRDGTVLDEVEPYTAAGIERAIINAL